MPQYRLRRAVAALVALPLLALGAGQAAATPAPHPVAAENRIPAIEDTVAHTLATALADSTLRERVRTATAATEGPTALTPLAAATPGAPARKLADATERADRQAAAAKGLGADLGPLLRVQLADRTMRRALDTGAAPLVATAATDEHARTIRAYDTAGRVHVLETATLPTRPVYLIDLDTAKAMTAGMALLQKELGTKGVMPAAPSSAPAAGASAAASATAASGWWATKITSIEVADDEEPWFKGAAEMFALVSGFGLDGKVRVDSVAMPYLQYDGTVYRPNQILVNWSSYKYNLADVVLMEDDGDTNYLALAQAIASALLTIVDQGAYIPLVNAVLGAMPSSWWTDDPDYVESWYTLARTSTGRLDGARGNGWMTVEPYFVQQF